MCVPCSLTVNKIWRKLNPNAIRSHRKNYYVRHKDSINSKNKLYQKLNPGVNRRATARWRKKNIEYARFLINRWSKRNREKRNFYRTVRRFLKRANGGISINIEQWKSLKLSTRNRCFYCRKKKRLTMDHYIPLSRGGKNNFENIVPACVSCNCRKHNKSPERFIKELKIGGKSA